MNDPAVSLDNVRHLFGSEPSLGGVSLVIQPGEIYGLVGPDGAGKTTAMRLMAGVMAPASGSVKIMGMNPLNARSGVREIMGYMPQRFSLYGDLSIAENMQFFGDLFCLPPDIFHSRRNRLLDMTGLAPFTDRRADALSGGMYKKLALSIALLHEPAVLLLDEPTNGVDPVSRAELWDLLYEFAARDMAIVVTTSYMDEADRCTRVGLLHQGTLLLEGRPVDLVGGFRDTAFFVELPEGTAADPSLLDKILGVLGNDIIAVTPLGNGIRIVGTDEATDNIQSYLRSIGALVSVVRPTFEDLFLSQVATADEAMEQP